MSKGMVSAFLLAGWMAFCGSPVEKPSEPPWRADTPYGGVVPAPSAERRMEFRLHEGIWSPRVRLDSTLRPWNELSPRQMERIRRNARHLIG